MTTFGMTCSCGHAMTCEADSRDAAVAKMKGMMDDTAIAKHMKEHHKPDEPTPTMAQVHAQIDSDLKAM